MFESRTAHHFCRRQKWWTKPQGFSSRGVCRSSLKTKGFLHIFTNSGKPCLWSRFITLSLHCTCEAAPQQCLVPCVTRLSVCVTLAQTAIAPLVKLPPVGGRMCYLYSAASPLSFFYLKPIAAEPLSSGIFLKIGCVLHSFSGNSLFINVGSHLCGVILLSVRGSPHQILCPGWTQIRRGYCGSFWQSQKNICHRRNNRFYWWLQNKSVRHYRFEHWLTCLFVNIDYFHFSWLYFDFLMIH